VKIRFEPLDAWVGFWFDTKGRRVFCCPLPFVAISWNLADPAAIRRYTDARRALNENYITDVTAGRLYETEKYARLNAAVADAEAGVSWWQLWLIDQRVAREQDFRARLGAAALARGLR
jgi:hypothetical protein